MVTLILVETISTAIEGLLAFALENQIPLFVAILALREDFWAFALILLAD